MTERARSKNKTYTFSPPVSFGELMKGSRYPDKLGLNDNVIHIGSNGSKEYIAVSPTPFAGPQFRELLAEIAPHPEANSSRGGIIGDLCLPLDFALSGVDPQDLVKKHARLKQWVKYLPHAEPFYRAANGDAEELTSFVKDSVNTKDEIINRFLRGNLTFGYIAAIARTEALMAFTAQFAKDHTGIAFDSNLNDADLLRSVYFQPSVNPLYRIVEGLPHLRQQFIESLSPELAEKFAENHNNPMSHPGIKVKSNNGEAVFAQGPYNHIPDFKFSADDNGFKVTQGDFFVAKGKTIGDDGNKKIEFPETEQKFSGFITPAMKWTSMGGKTGNPRYHLDLLDKSDFKELRPFIEDLIPDGMTYARARCNTLAGLMIATYFSPEIRERWEPIRRLPGNPKLQDMMGGQVGLSIIMDILTAVQSRFFTNAERYYQSVIG